MDRPFETIRLEGLVPYDEAYALQMARREAVEAGEAAPAVFLLEHAPTITLGRRADPAHVLASREALEARGIAVCEADRGGGVTYHGPGQLVAYPILDLTRWKCSISAYMRALEQAVIDVLAPLGLEGERIRGYTGVWTGGAKVAAIGVGIRRWVTFHGLALNVAPDWEHFACIVPCGIADKPVTSLERLLGRAPSMTDLGHTVEQALAKQFARPPAG